MNIGFIGLGLMGRPMALHLAQAGHTLHLWARRAASLEPFKDVATHAHVSAAEVARHADVVFTMVADVPDVEAVLFGADGVVAGGRNGLVVIDMSTINPEAARDFGRRLESLGFDFLDAPVSGGEVGAINATLTIMVGGKPEVFERARPLFDKLGKSVTLVGDCGAGQVAKACNQIITGVGIVALAEAFNFSEKSDVDPARVREALLGGFAYSKFQTGLQGLDAPEGLAYGDGRSASSRTHAANGRRGDTGVQRHRRQRHGGGGLGGRAQIIGKDERRRRRHPEIGRGPRLLT
jgi:3-hydroxyisobutyrate dehydrogenase-like beta-hydroxyacid dehydrogenase